MAKPGRLVTGGTVEQMHNFFPVTLGMCQSKHLRNMIQQVQYGGNGYQIKKNSPCVAMVEFTTLLPTESKVSVRPMSQIRLFKSSCCCTQEYLVKLVEISPHSATAHLYMANDGPLYSAARHTALKNQMWKSAETEAFTYFSQIWSQFQSKRCWASSDHTMCRDSLHLGTSPSLPQFPGLKDQQVTSQLGKVSVI